MKPLVVGTQLMAALVLALVCVSGYAESPHADALYWHHYAGTTHILQDPNATTLKQVAALPETAALRTEVLGKVAQAPFTAWHAQLPAGAQDQPALWRPLLDDFLSAESVCEVRLADGHLEAALALQLDDARAGLWNTNLARIVRSWKLSAPSVIKVSDASGWEAKNATTAAIFQIVRVRNWVVLGLAHERLTLLPAWVAEVVRSGQPASALKDNWLEVRIDFPALRSRCPALAMLDVPAADGEVTGRDGNLRMTAQLHYPAKFAGKPERWLIPTNVIGEPLISFTVAQGLAPLLKRVKGIDTLGLDPLPNQICLWGQSNPHVQTCATIPVANATNTMEKLARTLPPFAMNHPAIAVGKFFWISNRNALAWQAAPFVVPSLSPLREANQDYLLGCFFPIPPKIKPVPPALFAQIFGRKDLMYYDWELTSERLPQMNRMWQLIDIAKRRMIQSTNATSFRWIMAAAPLLGNTVTEITRTGDQEASLVRKSKLGLTAFEIATLAQWLNSPGFPVKFELPPPLTSLTNRVTAPKKSAPRTFPRTAPRAPKARKR